MTGQEAISIQVAREHVQEGERYLGLAERRADLTVHFSSLATANFTAAMAITNILLADPAEAPDVSF
jgi:hypothetical protein